jgi:biopolymer transport protein ExbB
MNFSLLEIWHSMGLPARLVATALMAMGLVSLAAFIERILTLRSSRAASKEFARETGGILNPTTVERVIEEAAKRPKGHLPRLVESGLVTYLEARSHDDGSGLTAVERTRRHLERKVTELSADLRRGLPILASVGSTAPFIGLLGTVLGIISAFQGIATSGSGGLSSVAAGISEALIETAFGLFVAIPAVLAFNYLSTDMARDELALSSSAGELLDTIEGWGEDGAKREGRRERVA